MAHFGEILSELAPYIFQCSSELPSTNRANRSTFQGLVRCSLTQEVTKQKDQSLPCLAFLVSCKNDVQCTYEFSKNIGLILAPK